MSAATKAGLLQIENNLHSIIAQCQDKELKADLSKCKKILANAIDKALEV